MREVGGRRAVREVVLGLAGEEQAVAVEAEEIDVVLPREHRVEPRQKPLLGEQHEGRLPRPRVLQHEAQPLGGVGRVERHVGAAGLEHGEQRGDHLGRALQGDADARLGADAEGAQPVRQTVGAAVQVAVGEPDARRAGGRRVDQGDRLGGARDLRLDETVEQGGDLVARGRQRAAVGVEEELLALVRGQHLQLRHACVRRGRRRVEKLREAPGHARHRRAVPEVAVVAPGDLEPAGRGLARDQLEVEAGLAACQRQR